jgi:hypothetical protein
MSRFAAAVLSAAAATPVDPTDPALGAVLLRIGLHSGPCSAGFVGRDHPKFTLFGDTINTAARMEQTAVGGRVQCSATTAALIQAQDPTIPLLARGLMDVKGKGMMETFWVWGEDVVGTCRCGGKAASGGESWVIVNSECVGGGGGTQAAGSSWKALAPYGRNGSPAVGMDLCGRATNGGGGKEFVLAADLAFDNGARR